MSSRELRDREWILLGVVLLLLLALLCWWMTYLQNKHQSRPSAPVVKPVEENAPVSLEDFEPSQMGGDEQLLNLDIQSRMIYSISLQIGKSQLVITSDSSGRVLDRRIRRPDGTFLILEVENVAPICSPTEDSLSDP